VSADRHWLALDHAFSQILSTAQVTQARERFAHRASALSEIVLPRLLDAARSSGDGSDSTSKLAKLRQTSRELAAALSVSWNEGDDGFRKL
jgi:hypothetical protein